MKVTRLNYIVFGLSFGAITYGAAAEALKDPMRPPGYAAISDSIEGMQDGKGVLSLSTTYVSEKSRYAMINRQRLREGDMVDGARVVSIKPGIVTLEREGEELQLRVLPPDMKKLVEKNP